MVLTRCIVAAYLSMPTPGLALHISYAQMHSMDITSHATRVMGDQPRLNPTQNQRSHRISIGWELSRGPSYSRNLLLGSSHASLIGSGFHAVEACEGPGGCQTAKCCV